jgi:Na+-driven multidrug efflux pump
VSDTRFIMIGIVLTFAGFLILGVIGRPFFEFTVQANEFGDCMEYTETGALARDCETIMQSKLLFFGLVSGLIGSGIVTLVKGYKGKWDQDVKNDEMVGPKKD